MKKKIFWKLRHFWETNIFHFVFSSHLLSCYHSLSESMMEVKKMHFILILFPLIAKKTLFVLKCLVSLSGETLASIRQTAILLFTIHWMIHVLKYWLPMWITDPRSLENSLHHACFCLWLVFNSDLADICSITIKPCPLLVTENN